MALIDHLVCCLPLDEASGTLFDSVSSNDVTRMNGVTSVAGKVGQAAHFDATLFQSLFGGGAAMTLSSAPFSLCFWARPTAFTAEPQVLTGLGRRNTDGQYVWLIALLSTGQLNVKFGIGAAGHIVASAATLTAGVWNSIFVWHDGVSLFLQVNNGTVESDEGAVFLGGGDNYFNIGCIGQNDPADHDVLRQFYTGDIDGYMIFDSAVTDQAERDLLWNLDLGVTCALEGEFPPALPWLPHPRAVVGHARIVSPIISTGAFAIPAPAIPDPEVFVCTEDREARVRFLLGRKMFDARFPQALLSQNVLRGERDVAVQALAFQERTTQRLTVGVQAYALPLDYITSWSLQIAKFSAGLRLYDSAGVAWYLIVTPAGDVSFASSQPSIILGTPGLRAVALIDELLTVRYIYPGLTGTVTVNTMAPGSPLQTASVQLRDTYGTPWYLAVSSLSVVTASRTGSATLLPPVLEPRAMVYVDPRAFTRLDPMAVDTPLYYTIFSKQQMRVYPAPTAVYDVVHYYWGDGLLNCDIPRWIDVEICWHSVRLAQIRLQHDGAARAASEFQIAGMQRMVRNYLPSYDSLDSYIMPVMAPPSQQ